MAAANRCRRNRVNPNTLERSVHVCTDLIPGCDYAGVSIVHRGGRIDTQASSDEVVERADALQYELREGPCLDAIWHHDTVVSDDLGQEQRWPRWAPRVADELGVRGMLSVQLFTSEDTLGGLNLYSRHVAGFTENSVDIATYLAAHVAVALAATQTSDQLRLAMFQRTVIGQAQGILMERYSIGADRAFELLRRVSQDNNMKLRQVATDLVETRVTPGS